MTLEQMIALYAAHAAAHKYIFGFIFRHELYYLYVTFEELRAMMKMNHASSKRGGHAKVRILSNKEQRAAFIESGRSIKLGPDTMLEGGNRGDNFEKIILELLTDNTWKKNSDPFWICGDMNINGDEVQVKLDTAELTNEKTLARWFATA